MYVFQTDSCVLLHFHLFGLPTTFDLSDLSYHSLYRITLDELDEFIRFAESLEKFRSAW